MIEKIDIDKIEKNRIINCIKNKSREGNSRGWGGGVEMARTVYSTYLQLNQGNHRLSCQSSMEYYMGFQRKQKQK